jgi:hypothetical protein
MKHLRRGIIWYGIAGFLAFLLYMRCSSDRRKDTVKMPVVGMTKAEVLQSYGAPGTVKDDGSRAVWTYYTTWGGSKKGILRFRNEKLVELSIDTQAQ